MRASQLRPVFPDLQSSLSPLAVGAPPRLKLQQIQCRPILNDRRRRDARILAHFDAGSVTFQTNLTLLCNAMTHPFRKPALLVFASLFVFTATAVAQSIDTKLAAQYFRQLKQTSDRDAGKTWGLALYGPLLFVDPRTGNVVANQADLEHKLTPQDGVFIGKLPGELNAANT